VARVHPDVRVPATLVGFAWGLVNVLGDAELQRLWGNMPEARFVPYLVLHVLAILAWFAALLVGGILAPVRPRRSTNTRTTRG
jgi:hypothetical protein